MFLLLLSCIVIPSTVSGETIFERNSIAIKECSKLAQNPSLLEETNAYSVLLEYQEKETSKYFCVTPIESFTFDVSLLYTGATGIRSYQPTNNKKLLQIKGIR